ncbi:carboxypeptidase-like regulatory domain-containing protein [Granulosicoccus sp.]|nr:carboxypeptidase-like regulatory domain-containing protein [Granulosicoccus sp.]
MFRRTIHILVLFMLLLFTAATLYVALEIKQFWTKEVHRPVDAEISISTNENHSPQQDSPIPIPYSSPQIKHEVIDMSAVSLNDRFNIAGSVSDKFGNPVQTAVVQLSSVTANVQLTTNSRVGGDFLLEHLLPANDYQLSVKSTPFFVASDALSLILENDVENLNIVLDMAHPNSLQCVIENQLGNPISELNLLVGSEEWSVNAVSISSDQSGKFSLVDFIPGRITLRSVSAPIIFVYGLKLLPDEVNYCHIIVDIGSQSMFGTVTREDGVPIPDVDIRMSFSRSHDDGYRSTTARSKVTNATGEFQFFNLGSGARTLKFSAYGFNRHEVDIDPSLNPGPHSIVLSVAVPPTH